ncbi:MAG: SH3 domain-containing protein [Bacteroidota bacterium]
MKQQAGFTLFERNEFMDWMLEQDLTRHISMVQNHHTFIPDYNHFKGNNHFDLQKSMQRTHKVINHWRDIGQHFTIFPDGSIMTGRSLQHGSACIKGQNAEAICIENLGNFDRGEDEMTDAQRQSIIHVNAVLNYHFDLAPNAQNNVYHHWYDLDTGNRTNGDSGVVKSCPGTAFFGGNSVSDMKQHFLPLVTTEWKRINALKGNKDTTIPPPLGFGMVTASRLNVRSGPGVSNPIVDGLQIGTSVVIFEKRGSWLRIGEGKWCSGKFVENFQKGVVTASLLNVRSGPGTNFRASGTIAKGSEVTVFETEGSWHRIELSEKWASARFIEMAG